ncbi:acyl-protein synthetase [Vibrio harveyi]|uniref:LuxE/PaaK family acyltransferase n=1 Tax=Vibrio harveyi TaxID=669 RepID=UPI001C955E11|nr:acyl-protein synthetase [Vibrio harveyi]MBY6236487.1 acyl-protein synthetase [Vibrio harveyi]
MNFEQLLTLSTFYTPNDERKSIQLEYLSSLTEKHEFNCVEYSKILRAFGQKASDIRTIEDIPFLPVRLFKEYDLKSIGNDDIFKTMTSSGTTGQKVSKIYLDKQTASRQTKILTESVNSYIGNKRLPMLIIDSPEVLKNRHSFSARGAGILGFSMFGRERVYALNEDMTINVEVVSTFLEKYTDKPIFIFGFTYIIWLHFIKQLSSIQENIDLSNGILFHGGGWKKLVDEAVSEEDFKGTLAQSLGLKHVYNYYGMVEQTGSIFVECEQGHMHASLFNDVLVRSPKDLSVLPPRQRGILQVISLLPESYPGHSLLTEDEGEIIGLDGCSCGRPGTHFKIYGRVKNAELRGCSDTYSNNQK